MGHRIPRIGKQVNKDAVNLRWVGQSPASLADNVG